MRSASGGDSCVALATRHAGRASLAWQRKGRATSPAEGGSTGDARRRASFRGTDRRREPESGSGGGGGGAVARTPGETSHLRAGLLGRRGGLLGELPSLLRQVLLQLVQEGVEAVLDPFEPLL